MRGGAAGETMKVESVKIGLIKPYFNNPRRRDEASIKAIADSITEFGWKQPLVVDSKRVIVIGHGRFEAAKLLGLKTVPVIVARDLTAEKARALRIADNRLNRNSDWDVGKLLEEIGGLREAEFNLDLTGFGAEDLKRLADDIDEAELEKIAGAEGDGEGQGTFTEDEDEEAGDDGAPPNGEEGEDQLVSFSEVVSIGQRRIINRAINLMRERHQIEKRAEALVAICQRYLEE